MTMVDTIKILVMVIGSLAVSGSVIYAALALKAAQRKTAYDIYDKFAERMFIIRALQINNQTIPNIWEGGAEGRALKEVSPQHFYFAKMLFQTNEAIYLALKDPKIQTDVLEMDLSGWRGNFKTDLSAPIFSKIWTNYEHVKNSYSKEFGKEVDTLIAELRLQAELGTDQK